MKRFWQRSAVKSAKRSKRLRRVRPQAWHLSRRSFLGGAGAVVALPFLEALAPKLAYGQDTGPPQRLLFYYIPNGIHMPSWTPQQTGSNYDLPLILEPLADMQQQVTVLTGLANAPARPDGPGDHASGTGAFLTAAHPYKTEGADIENGISVDQVAANALENGTTFQSIQLGMDGGSSVGGCDSGYSCAYSRNISWAGPQTPLPKMTNPDLVFDRFFGGFDPSATEAEVARRRRYSASVLDYVSQEANSLSQRLGNRDRSRLDEYLTGVRELEQRISANEDQSCEAPPAPDGGLGFDSKMEIMTELMVIAFECDLTRNISFMLGNAGSGRAYDFLGISEGHHDISHHQDNPDNFRQLETIDIWEVTQFTNLIRRLSEIQEGDSSVLDNSLILFSSEIEDGNTHSHYNMPVLLAGSAGGQIQPGQHIRYDNDEPVANLYISILDAVGVEVDAFGDDGTGPLSGLT